MSRYTSLFTGAARDAPSNDEDKKRDPYRLLLVDDEPNVLSALRRVFNAENYEIVTAKDGNEALTLLAERHFHLLISDYMMPSLNGAELLKRAKRMRPEMIRIMLTGHADTGAVMGAVNEGAVYKFILKPWNDDDLRVTVALALEQYDLIQRNRSLRQENAAKGKEIRQLNRLAVSNRSQLAIMLRKRGLLNDAQLQELYKLQQTRKLPMIRLLLEKGWVAEQAIRDILRKDLLVEEVQLAEFRVAPAVTELLPRSFCERQWVIPLKLEGRRLMLAVADPMDEGLVEDMRFVSGLEVQVVMADVGAIEAKIKDVYRVDSIDLGDLQTVVSIADPLDTIEVVIEEEEQISLPELLRSTEEPPAIRLVNAVILEALRLGVSDIHIQPRTKSVVVRYRIDGVLSDKIHIPHHLYPALVSRIKVMAELDITERRRPQDGRVTVKTPLRMVDLRVSTLPTISGEKVVLRILDRNAAVHRIEDLGFSAPDVERVLHMVNQPQGIILATGPTGSGKTTTLYALLQHGATPDKNYITVEDPVEYFMDMAGQVYVRERIGVDFATILRAILRQDPDVILLGEIRDAESAHVAFQAALTGHLVYSTLHTNSAIATVARLYDLGLRPHVVASALGGIIAQRLVRRICPECRMETTPDPDVLRQLGALFSDPKLTTYKGQGCRHCDHSGYRGRLALYEVLIPSDALRERISAGVGVVEIGQLARREGIGSLLQDAVDKVKSGSTTLEEVLRVLGAQLE